MACCCEQPGFGVLRQGVSWPGPERGKEGLAEGILSAPPDGRRILGPRALWSALRRSGCPPDCLYSSCEPPAHGFRRQRPDFHCADRCTRTSRSPFERRVNGREFQDDESCQLLLRLRVGPILHAALSLLKTYGRSRLRRFKSIGSDVDAGLDERLVVRPPSAEMRIAIVVLPHRKLFRCMVDHQSKLHRFSPLAQLSLALPAPIRMTGEKWSILQPSQNLLRISTGVEDLRRS